MTGHIHIPWLRIVPRRLSMTDAAGRKHTTTWLDPGDPRRESLPAHTRQQLDAIEVNFNPSAWGRYSWRTLIAVIATALAASAFMFFVGSYAMISRRGVIALIVIVLGMLPFIVLGLSVAGHFWSAKVGAGARIHACIMGGRCPACLAEINTLTPQPIDTARCACGAVWPTLGALQSGDKSVPVAATVDRAGELAWAIPLGLCSAVLSLGVYLLPFMNQVVGAIAGVLVMSTFAPFITAGRPGKALRLGLAVGVPPILFLLWGLVRYQTINMPLLLGGVAAFAVCFACGFIGRSSRRAIGWDIARFVCESCGYDLRGASAPQTPLTNCPECGGRVSRAPTSPQGNDPA